MSWAFAVEATGSPRTLPAFRCAAWIRMLRPTRPLTARPWGRCCEAESARVPWKGLGGSPAHHQQSHPVWTDFSARHRPPTTEPIFDSEPAGSAWTAVWPTLRSHDTEGCLLYTSPSP